MNNFNLSPSQIYYLPGQCMERTRFPHVLKNLENNQLIFQVLEMSLKFTTEIIMPLNKIHLEQKERE